MYGVEPLNDPYRFHPLPLDKADPKWFKLKENPSEIQWIQTNDVSDSWKSIINGSAKNIN